MKSYRDWVNEQRVTQVLSDLVRIPSVNPDFEGGNGEEEVAAVAHKGVVRFYVDLHGSAAHTSVPDMGINAIEHMAEVIINLKSFAEKNYPQRAHPLAGAPTLCVTQIEGGVAPNTVAEKCRITIDRRTVPGEDSMVAWEEIQTLLNEQEKEIPALNVIVQKPFLIDFSMEVSLNHPFVKQLTASANRYAANREAIGAPYCSDASN